MRVQVYEKGGGGGERRWQRVCAGNNARNLEIYTHIYICIYMCIHMYINILPMGTYLRPLSTSLNATAIQPSSSVLEAMTSARLPPATYMRKV